MSQEFLSNNYLWVAVIVPSLVAILTKIGREYIMNLFNKLNRMTAIVLTTVILTGCGSALVVTSEPVTNEIAKIVIKNKLQVPQLQNEEILKDFKDLSIVKEKFIKYLHAHLDGINIDQFNLFNDENNSRVVSFNYYNKYNTSISEELMDSAISHNLDRYIISDELIQLALNQGYKLEPSTKIIRKEKHLYTRSKLIINKWFRATPEQLVSFRKRGITDAYFISIRASNQTNSMIGWVSLKSISSKGITAKGYNDLGIVLSNSYNSLVDIIDDIIDTKTKEKLNEQFK